MQRRPADLHETDAAASRNIAGSRRFARARDAQRTFTGGEDVCGCHDVVTRSEGVTVPVTVNLDSLLDKAYESSTLQEILDAPVAALAGVSDADAEALKSAFNITTVADLGKNKYFQAAVALYELSRTGAK